MNDLNIWAVLTTKQEFCLANQFAIFSNNKFRDKSEHK
jgi:hypothetical protein